MKSGLHVMRERSHFCLVILGCQQRTLWGSSAGRKEVLVRVFIAVTKHHDHKQLRFTLQLLGHSPLLREVRAETQAGTSRSLCLDDSSLHQVNKA